jgi:tetratricopeptide (TPR) repeat protein/uncharacterized caspase-like protein
MLGKKCHSCIPLPVFIIMLITLLLMQCRDAGAESKGRRWAVVVGVNEYLNEVTPLHCAVNDAMKFKDALIESSGFEEKDIFLLTTDQPGNRKPMKANIIKRIAYIKAEAKAEDTFIFFFSGHGMDMEKQTYLLTYEADPYSKDTLDMSSLKVSDLKAILEGMPTEKILLLIDACRNDPRSGKGDVPNPLTESQSKGLIIKPAAMAAPKSPGAHFSLTFLSCKVGQRSYEWSEEGMGFFTYHVVKALKGAREARDSRGQVTLGSLKRYLGKEVPEAVKRERGQAMAQDPWVNGDASADADDYVLAMSGAGSLSQGTHSSGNLPPFKPASFTASNSEPAKDKTVHLVPPERGGSPSSSSSPADFADNATDYLALGDDYLNKRDYNNAIADYNRAAAASPKSYKVYQQRGIAFREKKNFDKAVADFEKSLALEPNNASLYRDIGKTYEDRRDLEKALSFYDKAIALDPRDSKAYNRKGTTYKIMNKFDEALENYSKAIEIDPRNGDAYYNRGNTYAMKGNSEGAFKDLTQAVKCNPGDAEAYMVRGMVSVRNQKYEQAIADYDAALKIQPHYAKALMERGSALSLMGRHQDAYNDLKRSLTLDPYLSMAYYNLGIVAMNLSKPNEAHGAFLKFIELALPEEKNFVEVARKRVQEIEGRK